MAAYTGPGQNPYAISITNNGSTSNAGMQSEQIPVVVGSTYQADITFGYDETWTTRLALR